MALHVAAEQIQDLWFPASNLVLPTLLQMSSLVHDEKVQWWLCRWQSITCILIATTTVNTASVTATVPTLA